MKVGFKRVAILLAIAAAAVAGTAWAVIPDGNGVIHGCYKKSGGALRVIDSAAANCTTGERPLNWGQIGPQGAIGPQGPQGTIGPPGPQGAAGEAVVFSGSVPVGPAPVLVRTVAGVEVRVFCRESGTLQMALSGTNMRLHAWVVRTGFNDEFTTQLGDSFARNTEFLVGLQGSVFSGAGATFDGAKLDFAVERAGFEDTTCEYWGLEIE